MDKVKVLADRRTEGRTQQKIYTPETLFIGA